MEAKKLKAKLKAVRDNISSQHAIRLHRAISWLKSAEDLQDNLDLQYISLWISFNACYANYLSKGELLSERDSFSAFINKLENTIKRSVFIICSGISFQAL
jgi:hypothetical protein